MNVSNCWAGRIGRGQLHAFQDHIDRGDGRIDAFMETNLRFHLALLRSAPCREIDLQLAPRTRVTIYTDASAAPDKVTGALLVKICHIVFCSALGVRHGGVATLPAAIIDSFGARATYIAIGEAFAILFAIVREEALLSDASVMFFMDNLCVLAALCKGSSMVEDFGCLVHVILLRLARLKAKAWFEYVDTKANLADGGSRVGVDCPDAARLCIPLSNTILPDWPASVVHASAQDWMDWFDGP